MGIYSFSTIGKDKQKVVVNACLNEDCLKLLNSESGVLSARYVQTLFPDDVQGNYEIYLNTKIIKFNDIYERFTCLAG